MLTVSIVLFKTDYHQLTRCINSINNSIDATIFLIDNSPTNGLEKFACLFNNVKYIFNPANPGYGAAHNLALRHALQMGGSYHLVLNADVYFDAPTIGGLINYMNRRSDVGLVMPKVLFPNGNIQYLCKLVPTPFDLIGRMIFTKKIWKKNNFKFEMRSTNYNKEMFVPYLSGCFMFLRTDALRKCGVFDERFFMYPEDIDLTRRIAVEYRTMFYPEVTIYHEYGAASKKSIKMLFIHAFNIIKYFNKWGWIFDAERSRLNKIATTNT
ncbi:glycosyltransferase family 2 protein [Polynucleobacter sp. TSB-Sco08W16]|uniref:glycosyltransferase family 2 protein n=1 Tax=Polynucleobacter sp. TSB-Sco08W16 TaxID=1758374 RepID=UPI001BFE800B|nr:glycosyltransferase family 2 protein [Polynucleobacter sp. TSB-Sco08W16]QWD74564.1 glycosyltransferase family 2 protein [Polynucleobacter sp. TSB-Sco08W16]